MKDATKSLLKTLCMFSSLCLLHTHTLHSFNIPYFNSNNTVQYSDTDTISSNSEVNLYGEHSTITVDFWDKNTFKLDAKVAYSQQDKQDIPYTIDKHKDELTISTVNTDYTSLEYHLLLPRNTKLKVMNTKGNISLSGAHAPVDLKTNSGSIQIKNANSGLTAQAPAGSISIEQSRLNNNQHIFVQAQKKIKMMLSPSIPATLKAHAPKGKVTSDICITLDPVTIKLNRKNWKSLQKNISGKIGSGGSSIVLESHKGSIHLTHDV